MRASTVIFHLLLLVSLLALCHFESCYCQVKLTAQNQVFRGVVIHQPPFSYINTNETNPKLRYTGFNIDLLQAIAANMNNVSFSFYDDPDGAFGALTSNGTWTGLIGESKYNQQYQNTH